MLRSRFFWKLYASYAALVIVTAVAIGVLIHGRLERALESGLEAEMRHQCVLVGAYAARVFPRTPGSEVEAEVARLGREAGVRITLIDPQGVVVADSDRRAIELENHLGRPEIRAAQKNGFGVSERFSKSVEKRMLYVARALRVGDDLIGYARVSIPRQQVDGELARVRGRTLAGALVGTIAALLIGLFVAGRITRPLAAMTRAADDLRRGDYHVRVRPRSHDEVGQLGETLNRLGAEIAARIAEVSQDDARLRAVLGGMADGVLAVDAKDRIVFCNRAAGALLGFDERTAIGQRLWEIVRLTELEELLSEARASESASRRAVTVHRRARETMLQAYATPISTSETGEAILVLHDVSEVRRLERIRRDFVANVSHELKTPLTSIRGFVETLLDGAIHDEENNLRFLGKIEENVGRLNHLVSDLLSLGRIESQGGRLDLKEVDWGPLLVRAVRHHDEAAREKDITLTADAPRGQVRVMGDEEAMTQVIDNLLGNAIKYTPNGGAVTVRLAREAERCVLEVGDTGIGIPAEDLDRIFERFYRVDKARSRELGGTGLGLSIVKHLVQAMGGEVSVESEFGKGSTFRVVLPLAP